MYRVHEYKYAPITTGAEKRYRIELPLGTAPIVYKTLTTGMRSWVGQVLKVADGRARAFIWEAGELISIEAELVGKVNLDDPCFVMEHLTIDGKMEFMIGPDNILNGDQNFVNFGIPQGKHIRIDIYTGQSKVIE